MTLHLWRLLAFLLGRYELIRAPDGSPYLSRWHFPKWLAKRHGCAFLFLHHFHQSDPDRGWHNHPWTWCESTILKGAYLQETFQHDYIDRRAFTPGQSNFLTAQFHAVRLYSELCIRTGPPNGFPVVKMVPRETWTLFRAGPKHGRSWGFVNRAGKFTPANEKT